MSESGVVRDGGQVTFNVCSFSDLEKQNSNELMTVTTDQSVFLLLFLLTYNKYLSKHIWEINTKDRAKCVFLAIIFLVVLPALKAVLHYQSFCDHSFQTISYKSFKT